MKAKKPERSVSEMHVLKDIRGLLSVTQERERPTEARPKREGSLEAEIAQLKQECIRYAELVKKQEEELLKLGNEKKELVTELNLLRSGLDKSISPASAAEELRQEIAQLEARKNDLSLIVSQIESLLQLKFKELSRRIVRFYQEAGQEGVAIEFRKAASELEAAETFAYFIRELLRQ